MKGRSDVRYIAERVLLTMGETGAMGKETAEESLQTQEIYKRMGQILPYCIRGLSILLFKNI